MLYQAIDHCMATTWAPDGAQKRQRKTKSESEMKGGEVRVKEQERGKKHERM